MSDDSDTGVSPSEQKMRLALEARRGTPFTEQEWDEAKRNLVGLFLAFGLHKAGDHESGEES